jgi:hypothetical protein
VDYFMLALFVVVFCSEKKENFGFTFHFSCYLMQVKVLNKLALARAKDLSVGSKILADMIDGLDEAAVAVEIRLKIDQNHANLKGGYVYLITFPKYYTRRLSSYVFICVNIK